MTALMALIIWPVILGFVSFFCLMFLLRATIKLTQLSLRYLMNGPYAKPMKHLLRKSWDRP